MPKSITLRKPLGSTTMFCGLMSRWITPWSCATSSARHSCLPMVRVTGTGSLQLIGSRGRLPVPVTLTIGKQLCRALEVAHEQGIIHRDIKPQNIVVEPSGFLKVMDFGIAGLANPPQGKGLTQEGASIGTPDYMSPE